MVDVGTGHLLSAKRVPELLWATGRDDAVELPDGTRAVVDIVALYHVDAEGRILSLRAFWEMDQIRFEPAPA